MKGRLEVVVGAMFSGKSEMLIDRLVRAKIARRSTVMFKHRIDSRYAELQVVSHSNVRHSAIPISSTKELLSQISNEEVIGVDEIQFFTADLVPVLDRLASEGRRVIVAGLDMDFLNRPFHTTQQLTSRADRVDKLTSVCDGCQAEDATRSQLFRDGKPVTSASSSIVVGGSESYKPFCRSCFVYEENNSV